LETAADQTGAQGEKYGRCMNHLTSLSRIGLPLSDAGYGPSREVTDYLVSISGAVVDRNSTGPHSTAYVPLSRDLRELRWALPARSVVWIGIWLYRYWNLSSAKKAPHYAGGATIIRMLN
jgi:hypothetical protein